MFHIIETREVLPFVFLEGWLHYKTYSHRYYRNDRRVTDARTSENARGPATVTAARKRLGDGLSQEGTIPFPAAMSPQAEHFMLSAEIITDGEVWKWQVFLPFEKAATQTGTSVSRRAAVDEADSCLTKYLNRNVHDEPVIPWTLTDRMQQLEMALAAIPLDAVLKEQAEGDVDPSILGSWAKTTVVVSLADLSRIHKLLHPQGEGLALGVAGASNE